MEEETIFGEEDTMFGEEGERLREDRASFLLGLAKGLQKKNVKSDGFCGFCSNRILHHFPFVCM